MNTDCLQFDQGIMRLSLFDPTSNQYEIRILTLPELPLLESLENLFENVAFTSRAVGVRMTKSCHAKKMVTTDGSSSPRRCQSNPNFSKQQGKKILFKSNNQAATAAGGPIRSSKRSLSNAFTALTGFIHKKIRFQQQQQQQPYQWPKGTLEVRRLSSLSSISSLSLSSPASSTSSFRHRRISSSHKRTVYPSALDTCENWWTSSPPISSC